MGDVPLTDLRAHFLVGGEIRLERKDWPSPEMEFLDEGDRSPYTNYPPNDDPSVRASGHFNMSFGLPTLVDQRGWPWSRELNFWRKRERDERELLECRAGRPVPGWLELADSYQVVPRGILACLSTW
jgi:hypothetical protein